MKEAGIASQDHLLMQENLATYLAHRVSGIPSKRWQSKIDRDLANPYTDDQVLQRIDDIQELLKEKLSKSGNVPGKLYITGSLAKGRFSPADELDILNVVSQSDYPANLGEAMNRAGQKDLHFFPLREDQTHYNRGMLMVDGVSREFQSETLLVDGALKDNYLQSLSEKKTHRRELQPRMGMEKWLGKAHRSRYDSESLHSRMMQTAVATLGLTSQVPLLGPLVSRAFEMIIPQNHN